MEKKMKFNIYYNNIAERAECSFRENDEWTPCVPQDIWDDFVSIYRRNGKIEDSLLYKAIRPKEPAIYRRPHSFSFSIYGKGIAPNYLGRDQEGAYLTRPATEIEKSFRERFSGLCQHKFYITPLYKGIGRPSIEWIEKNKGQTPDL